MIRIPVDLYRRVAMESAAKGCQRSALWVAAMMKFLHLRVVPK